MLPMPPPKQAAETSALTPVPIVQRPPQRRSSARSSPPPQSPQPGSTFSDSRLSNPSSSTPPSVPSSPSPGKSSGEKPSRAIQQSETPPTKQAATPSHKPEPSQSASDSSPPQSTETELSDPQAAQIEFQTFITGVKTGDNFTTYSLLEILELFGQPGQIELFFNPQGEQKPGILEFQVFPDQSLEQVIQDVVQPELGDRQGFTLQEQQADGNSKVFAVTKQGFTRYIQLLSLNARSGTLLVVWDRLPAIAPYSGKKNSAESSSTGARLR